MLKKELFCGIGPLCPFALEDNQELNLKDNWGAIRVSEDIQACC